MKKTILVALLFLLCGSVFGQIYLPIYPRSYGVKENRAKTDSAQHVPEKDSLYKNTVDTSAQVFYNRQDSSIWAYSKARGFWKIGTGGSNIWGGITGTLSDQTDLQDSLNTRVRGSGTSNYIPRWTGTNTIGNSTLLYDNDVNAGTTNRFLAPSMGSASTNNHYTFYYDANEGQGPVFTGTDGGVIQFLRLAGYKYVQDYPTSSKGFYVGTYLNSTYNSYILFKSMGNRIMMNTLTDSSHKTVIHGTSIKIDADTITVNNIPDAVDMTNKKAVVYDEIDERLYVIEEDSVGGASTSGVTGIGSINSATKSSNGAVVVGSNLIMQNADATYPGLMSPAHYNFLDSVRSGLVADSSYLGLVAGPGSYDSLYVYIKPYGESTWDSAFQILIPKLIVGGSGITELGNTGNLWLTLLNDSTYAADSSTISAYLLRRKDSLTASNPNGYVTKTILADSISNLQAQITTLENGYGIAREWIIACSDETTAITTGTAKVTFRVPYEVTVLGVRASVNTVSSSGTPTVDINENGTTILSTKLTIDASEKTSVTAATAAVISDSTLADDSEITIDIDTAGTGTKGLKVIIYYKRNAP